MISSDENWVIECWYPTEPEKPWQAMSAGAVAQLEWEKDRRAFDLMIPTSLEEAIRLATCQQYNLHDYYFRLRNVVTNEIVPFEAFL